MFVRFRDNIWQVRDIVSCNWSEEKLELWIQILKPTDTNKLGDWIGFRDCNESEFDKFWLRLNIASQISSDVRD